MNRNPGVRRRCEQGATGCLQQETGPGTTRADEPPVAPAWCSMDAFKARSLVVRLLAIVAVFASGAVAEVDIEKDYPPLPDFETRVDYVAWFEKAAAKRGDQDAYRAYARFMPELVESNVKKEEWPEFAGMLTTARPAAEADPAAEASLFSGALGPFPWDPKRKQDWEASFRRSRKVLKQFAAASKAGPLVAPTGLDASRDDRANRLMFATLRHTGYSAACAGGQLETAWRMEDGKVSAKRFLEAVETNLHLANQLRDALFHGEHQAAHVARHLTYRNIRWALAHEVLKPKEAARLAGALAKLDRQPLDLSKIMRGECAIYLDALQYVYGPLTGGGLKLNGNRFREITGQSLGAMNRFGLGARVERDPQEAAKAIRDGYAAIEELMTPGYTEETYHAIKGHTDRINGFNNVTKAMNMAGNYAQLYLNTAQCEAHRRGAHLLVELFAHKAKKKAWPKTLKSLKGKGVDALKEDVFRDESFVYMLVDGEPVLYSVGPDGKDDGGTHNAEGVPGTDLVFWPIPHSAELIAASRLMRTPAKKLTPPARIDARMKGKRVVVSASVAETSSRPDAEHGHRYSVILEQKEVKLELVYYQGLADRLTRHQKIASGKRLRVRAKVGIEDGKAMLELTDPLDLVIEE